MSVFGDPCGIFQSLRICILVAVASLFIRPALCADGQDPDPWRLRAYEAVVKGDPSVCGEDKFCADHVRYYRSMICVADSCQTNAKANAVAGCAPDFARQYTSSQQERINAALCAMHRDPSKNTRRDYLDLVVEEGEDEVVELGGYALALRSSAGACVSYILEYVGPYGPRWSFAWYRALSGCRILGRERTKDEETRDLATWTAVFRRKATCADIIHPEIRRACQARDAASPEPVYEQLW